jgi:CRP-like cAMP-binding protein
VIPALLKKAFDPYYSLPVSDWESIAAFGETETVGSETILKGHDSAEKNLRFILQGSAGVLLWNKNNFICTDMFFENDFVCDFLSFVTNQPTPYESVTFEKTELFRIPLKRFENYISQHHEGDKIWRSALAGLYVEKHYQQLQLLTYTATERYKLILQHQPFILQKVPLKYIASYLGVTPQSLSRIRTELGH